MILTIVFQRMIFVFSWRSIQWQPLIQCEWAWFQSTECKFHYARWSICQWFGQHLSLIWRSSSKSLSMDIVKDLVYSMLPLWMNLVKNALLLKRTSVHGALCGISSLTCSNHLLTLIQTLLTWKIVCSLCAMEIIDCSPRCDTSDNCTTLTLIGITCGYNCVGYQWEVKHCSQRYAWYQQVIFNATRIFFLVESNQCMCVLMAKCLQAHWKLTCQDESGSHAPSSKKVWCSNISVLQTPHLTRKV